MSHSCTRVGLEEHFVSRPRARELFNALREAIESQGPVTIAPNKGGIPFMTRARFVGCQVRKDYLRCHVWLKRRAESPRFVRIDQYGPKDFVHVFEIRSREDIDEELLVLLREGRAVGDQTHLMSS
jgi:uncharacterized protein DUF5655